MKGLKTCRGGLGRSEEGLQGGGTKVRGKWTLHSFLYSMNLSGIHMMYEQREWAVGGQKEVLVSIHSCALGQQGVYDHWHSLQLLFVIDREIQSTMHTNHRCGVQGAVTSPIRNMALAPASRMRSLAMMLQMNRQG